MPIELTYNILMPLQPQHSLLLDYFYPEKHAKILLLEGGDGRLASVISQLVPDGYVLTLDRDVRQVWSAQDRLKGKFNASTDFSVFPCTENWDYVLLTIPKGRRYARSLLLSAWQSLKPGGKLLLTGPTRKGAKAVIKDAKRLFGNAAILGYRHHQRAAACTRDVNLPNPLPDVYQQNGIAPGTVHSINISTRPGNLLLETHPGIFSWEDVDDGTGYLLQNWEFQSNMRVWDVGCGYGVLGLFAATMGASEVLMTDINLIAISYAQKNALNNHLDDRVHIEPADGLNLHHSSYPFSQFDIILSNPAFHQDRDVDKSMAASVLSTAPGLLSPNGRLVIVANRFLNYERDMRNYFQKVNRIANNGKFEVLAAYN